MHCAHVSKPQERIAKSLLLRAGFFSPPWQYQLVGRKPACPISIRISNLPCELPTFHLTATCLLGKKHADRFAIVSDSNSSDNASNVFLTHTAAHS